MRALGAALTAIVVLLALPLAAPAAAQEEPTGTSYITPFPEGDVYKLQAYGDPFAEGLLAGLTESFAGDARLLLSRRHRPLAGLARPEFDDEMKAEEANKETFHIGVVMIGFWDRIHMRVSARDRIALGSSEWREEYGKRVDRLIKTLKRKGIALYWVGLPIMRRYEVNEAAQAMNDVAREKTYLNGIKFIDIQAHFADEAGNYAPYGPDITGKQRLLREADGMLFTAPGNRKLALFVEQEIKRDLNQAKNERAIPLAGNEAEQKRVAALRPRPQTDSGAGWKGTVAASNDGKAAPREGLQRRPRRARGRYLQRPEGRQRPHHAEEHRRRRTGGIRHRRHPPPGHPLRRGGADDAQGIERPSLADGRRGGRRRRRWAGGAELDHAGERHRRGPHPPARPQPQPVLPGADQGGAARRQAGPGRRFLLAARRARGGAGAPDPAGQAPAAAAPGRRTAQLTPPDVIPDSRRAERGMRPVTFSCCRSGRGSRFQSLGGNDGMLLANLKKQRGRSEATPVRSAAMCRKGGSCRPPLD